MSCIVKSRFRTKGVDSQSKIKFLEQTVDVLSAKYGVIGGRTFRIENVDEDLFSIQTDLFDVIEIEIHDGFWHIETGAHYCQLFYSYWWAMMLCEIADALGEKDLWPCSENMTWNGCPAGELENITFEQWLAGVSEKNNGIKEFQSIEELKKYDNFNEFYPANPVYHMTTDSYRIELASLSQKLPEYEVCGLTGAGNTIPCKKDGMLYLINKDTKQVVNNSAIDSYEISLNGPEFIIYKDGKCRLMDEDGNPLSEFSDGIFEWKWEMTDKWPPKRIIYNEETGFETIRQ